MAKMIVGVLDTSQEARAVVEELITNGFSRDAIGFLAPDFRTTDTAGPATGGEHQTRSSSAMGAVTGLIGLVETTVPGIGPVIAAGPLAAAVTGATAGGRGFEALGIPEQEADYFAASVADGSTLISVTTDNDSAQRAADILRRQGVSETEREHRQQEPPLERQPRRAEEAASPGLPAERPAPGPMAVTPKGPEPERGVHIYSQVYETPGEHQLRLREERAGLEGFAGKKVQRPEGEAEGVQAQKRAQRGGEERASILGSGEPGTKVPGGGLLKAEDDEFRRHFREAYAKQGEHYRDYRSAYYYAENRSHDQEYQGKEWSEVEEQIRREWDRTHPGTWSRFREALHFAWDRSRHHRH